MPQHYESYDLVSWMQANGGMEVEMLRSNVEALHVENEALKSRMDSTLSRLVAAATPSNPALIGVLKVRTQPVTLYPTPGADPRCLEVCVCVCVCCS